MKPNGQEGLNYDLTDTRFECEGVKSEKFLSSRKSYAGKYEEEEEEEESLKEFRQER